jgi:hypothetical protein
MLVNMFQLAMDSLQNPSLEDPHREPPSPVQQGDSMNAGQWSAVLESESTLASFIMMLDIIAKQVRHVTVVSLFFGIVIVILTFFTHGVISQSRKKVIYI